MRINKTSQLRDAESVQQHQTHQTTPHHYGVQKSCRRTLRVALLCFLVAKDASREPCQLQAGVKGEMWGLCKAFPGGQQSFWA